MRRRRRSRPREGGLHMRWIRRLWALAGFGIALGILVLGGAAYVARSGHSPRAWKEVARRLAPIFGAQRTERLELEVLLRPDEGHLRARAVVTVRPSARRRRFYFVLNPGLRVRAVHAAQGPPEASAYHLWTVLVLDAGRHVDAGEAAVFEIEYEGQPTSLAGDDGGRIAEGEVVLRPGDFWFPADLQGAFTAALTVILPARLTLIHSGEEDENVMLGAMRRVRWHYARPVHGLSLTVASCQWHDRHEGGVAYRLCLPEPAGLDAQRVLDELVAASDILTGRYGPAGFPAVAAYVSGRLRRGFNDGAGTLVLPMRSFRRGDYGFAAIAHAVAHNWWGGTVAEQWLRPGTGGQWIVEGLAEFSSWLALEERFGEGAGARRRAEEFFDPRAKVPLREFSAIDNALGDHRIRRVISGKGAYVAWMLRRVVGDDAFFGGLRSFLERFRYQSATEEDLEAVLAQVAGRDLSEFFTAWVRSASAANLRVEETGGRLVLRNAGDNPVVGPAEAWMFSRGEEPVRKALVSVGEEIVLPGDATAVIVDPLLLWADVDRHDNRFPRRSFPQWVSVSRFGARAVLKGEPYPWSPAELRVTPAGGGAPRTWDAPPGTAGRCQWVDERHLLLSADDGRGAVPAIVIFDTDAGMPWKIGRGSDPAAGPGVVYAARGARLLRWRGPEWREEEIGHFPGREVGSPAPAPDGRRVAYFLGRDGEMELHVRDAEDATDQLLLSWERGARWLAWSPDAAVLFVGLGARWDWQVWQVRLDGAPPSLLVSEAAVLGNLAVAPGGAKLAFPAVPAVDPRAHRELFLLDLNSRQARRLDVGEEDVWQVEWEGDEHLLVVAGPAAGAVPWYAPRERHLRRLRLADGSLADVESAQAPP